MNSLFLCTDVIELEIMLFSDFFCCDLFLFDPVSLLSTLDSKTQRCLFRTWDCVFCLFLYLAVASVCRHRMSTLLKLPTFVRLQVLLLFPEVNTEPNRTKHDSSRCYLFSSHVTLLWSRRVCLFLGQVSRKRSQFGNNIIKHTTNKCDSHFELKLWNHFAYVFVKITSQFHIPPLSHQPNPSSHLHP